MTNDMLRPSSDGLTSSDQDLSALVKGKLYTAVVADALDQIGIRNQAMREYLRPVCKCPAFFGWARTIACCDVYHVPPEPYAMEIEAIDSILPGEVVVVSTQQSKRNAPWGELLSTAARARGAHGAVIDGLVRDVGKIEELGFPVLAAGIKPVDSIGRGIVTGYNVPVECGEVLVNPGDFVFADLDGVIVVPRANVEEVLHLALNKATRENSSRAELMEGAYLRDVYRKYGVL